MLTEIIIICVKQSVRWYVQVDPHGYVEDLEVFVFAVVKEKQNLLVINICDVITISSYPIPQPVCKGNY